MTRKPGSLDALLRDAYEAGHRTNPALDPESGYAAWRREALPLPAPEPGQ